MKMQNICSCCNKPESSISTFFMNDHKVSFVISLKLMIWACLALKRASSFIGAWDAMLDHYLRLKKCFQMAFVTMFPLSNLFAARIWFKDLECIFRISKTSQSISSWNFAACWVNCWLLRSSQYISGDEYDDCLWPPVGLFEQIVAPKGISIQSLDQLLFSSWTPDLLSLG